MNTYGDHSENSWPKKRRRMLFMTTCCATAAPYPKFVWEIDSISKQNYSASPVYVLLHSQKRASCSKSSNHQADIRMRSHRLLRLDDNKSVTSFNRCKMQTACRLDVSWSFINSQQICKYQVTASLVFTDLMQLDEVNRLDTTCWQIASSQ